MLVHVMLSAYRKSLKYDVTTKVMFSSTVCQDLDLLSLLRGIFSQGGSLREALRVAPSFDRFILPLCSQVLFKEYGDRKRLEMSSCQGPWSPYFFVPGAVIGQLASE